VIHQFLYVGLGGFVGAILRYGVSGLMLKLFKNAFPLGTFTVNVLGCLILGFLMTIVEDEQHGFPPNARFFVAIGLLGSFTTFSTFGYETIKLVRDGDLKVAVLYVFASLIVGLLAVVGGHAGARAVGY
jgi:CrcB protein